jgi:hypothetical protein
MSESYFSRRMDAGAAPLAVGDVLAILLVIVVGEISHFSVQWVQNNPVEVLITALPFLVGWAIAALFIGAYSAGAAESAKAAIPLGIRSWVPAAIIGILIRGALSTFDVGLGIFLVVMLVTGSLTVGVWRWLFFKVA